MYSDFTAALFDPRGCPPNGLIAGSNVTRRFDVYRNNLMYGLTQALAQGFPVLEKIVGVEFFAAMAREYVRAEPPRSPVLIKYGETLPDFLNKFAPVAHLPYLADVASLEFARRMAFHAVDFEPMPPHTLSLVSPERFADLRITLIPACRILRSSYPTATIWSRNSVDGPVAAIEDWQAEDVLVFRTGTGLTQTIETRRLPPGHARFLECLSIGGRLSEAAESAFSEFDAFDFPNAVAGLFIDGLVAKLQ